MTNSRLRPIAMLVAATVLPQPARACIESAGRMSVFFASRPADIPSGIVALKVEAPADAKDIGGIDVALLEPAGGVRGMTSIRVLVEPTAQDCKQYDLGLVGRPAYIFGNYERTGNGPVFFRARWLPSRYPVRVRGKPWQSYVVDPAYLPTPDKQ